MDGNVLSVIISITCESKIVNLIWETEVYLARSWVSTFQDKQTATIRLKNRNALNFKLIIVPVWTFHISSWTKGLLETVI